MKKTPTLTSCLYFCSFFPSSTRLSVCLSSARGWFTLQSTLRRSWSRKWSCRKPSEETWYAARLAVWRRRRCRRKRPREWRVCLPGRTRAPCTTAWWSWVTPWEPAPLLSCPSCSGLSTPPSTATLTLRPVASSGESPAYRSGEAALERVSHPLPACLRRKLLNARLASSLALIPLCLEAARVPDRLGCFPTGRCVGQKSNTGTLCGEEQAFIFLLQFLPVLSGWTWAPSSTVPYSWPAAAPSCVSHANESGVTTERLPKAAEQQLVSRCLTGVGALSFFFFLFYWHNRSNKGR